MNEFRHTLRRERMARGMSQDALGAEVHISGSQIGHYESGRSIPPDDVAAAFDAFFGTGDKLRQQTKQARGEAIAPWLRPWKENEERSTLLRTFQTNLVPGLLQTEAYARMVLDNGLRTEAHVAELTRDRMARQAATLGRSNPVAISAIMCEPVLRTGDPTIMKEQLEHLVDIGHRQNVRIWVIPTSAGVHAGHAGPFVLATLTNGDRIGYLDDQLEGKIVSSVGKVTALERVWESVVDLALPGRLSRDLILKVIDEHEQ
ncbi:helix-turn-helix transcriptional regulator [Solwaraspora sp. WMMD1047]|uniref:helix-turn-helix domain-containing protein n=1 Tax=Solwaraspora sp. WMMD1047 TaxID=3016102 RepID=UPI0024159D3A|nr:helix-turn-helix transcriptional regulator [Solwaraspora sp. WMMD1047]MDG4829084.1 helix-turn-helix transcriptional regulator [Solwaraspora sp. WMMD1047]